jgi:hypothetical protein
MPSSAMPKAYSFAMPKAYSFAKEVSQKCISGLVFTGEGTRAPFCFETEPPEDAPKQQPKMRLVDELFQAVKTTPECQECAAQEPYQDFRLLHTEVTPWSSNQKS